MTRSLLLLAALLTACSPQLSDDDDAAVDDDDTAIDDDDSTDPVDDDDDNTTDPGPAPVQICESTEPQSFSTAGWAIAGDTLTATVEYSGGCETHEFIACWDTLFLESNPVQVGLVLQDLGPLDPCLAFITETVQIDLSPLADAWVDSYGPPPGEIIVNIDGASDSYVF